MKDSVIRKTAPLDVSKDDVSLDRNPGAASGQGEEPRRQIYVPGPARVMYGIYAGFMLLVIYTGFSYAHPFVSGWRYPWGTALMQTFNWVLMWGVVLVAVVYLYYALIDRPARWNEPLGWYRILLALLAIWFFLLTGAIYQPYGWMHWLVVGLGGPVRIYKVYELFLWIVLLANLIYVYARWAASPRFPKLTAPKKAE